MVWLDWYFSVHGIFQAQILKWVAISFSRGSSWFFLTQGLNPCLLHWQAEWISGKEGACSAGDVGSVPGLRRFPWSRKWQPTPVFLPGKSHEQRSWVGYSSCQTWLGWTITNLFKISIILKLTQNGRNSSKPDKWLISRIYKRLIQLNGEGNGTPLQYSCLENPMDGGAWWAAVHGVAKSRTQLSNFTFTFHFHALDKEMTTHSSVLAWRIPGAQEPGGLPSLGLRRVGHDCSSLAAAAAFSSIPEKQTTQSKRWQKIWTDVSPEKTYTWCINT